RFYHPPPHTETLKQPPNHLLTFLQHQLQKQQNKFTKLIHHYQTPKNKQTHQLYAHFITPNIYHIQQGHHSLIAFNYYT
ncbi:NFACT family protein, partial [Staphylococcus epidermidis]|uniref:NFACT family protein n=1 Tax=Staphylococcus epidermidis TaxID=1282 RepID=UPI0021B4515D